MATNGIIGSVAALWRFPVKSIKGEQHDPTELKGYGLVDDRVYTLIDAVTGKVEVEQNPKLFPNLLGCQAVFVERPQANHEPARVRIPLPDGTTVTSDSGEVDWVLSGYFGRDVTLARKAPANFTIYQYHLDIEGLHPAGYRNTTCE